MTRRDKRLLPILTKEQRINIYMFLSRNEVLRVPNGTLYHSPTRGARAASLSLLHLGCLSAGSSHILDEQPSNG
jgi:hypothetical protein